MYERNLYLDRVRAAAISAVVVFHVVQMSPISGTLIAEVTRYGQYGVDLFFALSGWLIGTLFWQEYKTHGNVELSRFWSRRAIRTIPPYAIALMVSWAAVRYTRGLSFDFGYLVFAQNYYQAIPFFLVSWSLCVEEHFYFVAPIFAHILVAIQGIHNVMISLLLLLCLPLTFRALEYDSILFEQFGYSTTATHLRMDGLLAGFAMSYIAVNWPILYTRMLLRARMSISLLIFCAAVVIVIGGATKFVFLPVLLAFMFCLVVAVCGSIGKNRKGYRYFDAAIKPVALAAYSTYLTHPLAIHVVRECSARLDVSPNILYWPLVTISIAMSSMAFWWAIEWRSIALRDYLVPKRTVGATHNTRSDSVRASKLDLVNSRNSM